jgi:hypothetical protein
LVLGAALLAFVSGAGAAQAAGIAATWNRCQEDGGSTVRFVPCNSNTGKNEIVSAFSPPAGITSLRQVVATYRICPTSHTLPAWWDFFNPGSCRQSSLQWAPYGYSSTGTCVDPWDGVPVTGSVVSYGPEPGSDLYRLVAETHTVDGSGVAVDPYDGLQSYEAVRLAIDYAGTTGDGACAGCLQPVVLMLTQLELKMADGSPSIMLTTNYSGYGTSTPLNWQPNSGPYCLYTVPTRASTWGSLKSLYR